MIIKNKNYKLKIIVACTILLFACLLGVYFLFIRSNDRGIRDVNSVDYSGPTSEEKAAADSQKIKNIEREKTNQGPKPDTAKIIIVDAGQYDNAIEVRSYVSNVFEDGGLCVITLTKNGYSPVTATSKGIANASYTQCENVSIPIEKFTTKGVWKLTLSYESQSITGSNNSTEITIQ